MFSVPENLYVPMFMLFWDINISTKFDWVSPWHNVDHVFLNNKQKLWGLRKKQKPVFFCAIVECK